MNKVVLISCDNQSAVTVCCSGRTKDPFLNACLHALWLQTARFNISLRVAYTPGRDNTVADALSRGKFQSDCHQHCEAVLCNVLQLSL